MALSNGFSSPSSKSLLQADQSDQLPSSHYPISKATNVAESNGHGTNNTTTQKPPESDHPSNVSAEGWRPDSWRTKTILQLPTYLDEEEMESVLETIRMFPLLVLAGEVRALEERLAEAAMGRAFVLQGGDCAESFKEFSTDKIQDTFSVLLQMGAVLTYGGQLPVIKVGRIAGQFAKPRSTEFEEREGLKLPIYKGDIVNGLEFDEKSRTPDPQRMMRAYSQSAATLNLLRAFLGGGEAAMLRLAQSNLHFADKCEQRARYSEELVDRIEEALGSMGAAAEFWTSHECLLLPYEQQLTRQDSSTGLYYDFSAHFLWVGERTRQLHGAHVEFLRGVSNPLGIKVSEKMEASELVHLIQILNPDNKPGRVTVITRMGAHNLRVKLPHLIRAVHKAGQIVTWVCDPVHGNAIKAPCGLRTRSFDAIVEEVEAFFDVHEEEGSHPGGIHLEMTGQDVTECIGGLQKLTLDDLKSSGYQTHCDPRLNADQSLELSCLIADRLSKRRVQVQP
ncbi:3-deoxy-7-phosphoheptulonate synthase [Bertholletia excelsa]